jgi:hypothetical protein
MLDVVAKYFNRQEFFKYFGVNANEDLAIGAINKHPQASKEYMECITNNLNYNSKAPWNATNLAACKAGCINSMRLTPETQDYNIEKGCDCAFENISKMMSYGEYATKAMAGKEDEKVTKLLVECLTSFPK